MFRPVQNFFWQLFFRRDQPGAVVTVAVDVAAVVVDELYYSVEGKVGAVIFRYTLRKHR